MMSQLIPAGRKIGLSRTGDWKKFLEQFFDAADCVFTTSGTAALVYALSVLKKKKPGQTEVILPAYTCPDVLSAILYCKLTPVLVDLNANSTCIDHEKLKICIGKNTLAVIAIDLFGVPDDYARLSELTKGNDVFLVRDSAQSFSGGMSDWLKFSDVVVVTFGRGKPVTLLGGGVVMFNKAIQHRNNNQLNQLKFWSVIKFYIRSSLYNFLTNRTIYWWIDKAPLLHIGKTEFHDFSDEIVSYSASIKFLPQNITSFLRATNKVQAYLIEALGALNTNNVMLPININNVSETTRLNRLPILVNNPKLREHIFKELNRNGLGVSKMYPKALPSIISVPDVFGDYSCEQAEIFSNEILTLPVHEMVTIDDAKKMLAIISTVQSV